MSAKLLRLRLERDAGRPLAHIGQELVEVGERHLHPRPWILAATLLEQQLQGDDPSAWNDTARLWQRAADLDPKYCPTQSRWGFALLKSGKAAEAAAVANRALQVEPNCGSALALAALGATEQAEKGSFTRGALESHRRPTQEEGRVRKILEIYEPLHRLLPTEENTP